MAEPRKEPKLPTQQLVILSLCRFADPVAFTSVFPYLPEMIESFHVPKRDVAQWVGITSASFSLSQCVTGILLGRASDRYGRKLVILIGVLCTMAASLAFGFSQSLAWAIAARSLAGASAGGIGVIRTTVAEMVPERELQPRAFSVMPLVWSTGSILGPVLGGVLAKPATNFPQIFGDSWLLKKFPFALPNLVACCLYVFGLPIGFMFLKETLETKKHKRDLGRVLGRFVTRLCCGGSKRTYDESEQERLMNGHKPTEFEKPPSYWEVFSPQSSLNLLAYSLLALHSIAFDQLLPVFLHMSVGDESARAEMVLPFKFVTGFGLDSARIGLLFTIYGIVSMSIQFLVFPPIAKRYGVLNCLKACSLVFPIAYILIPFSALFANSTTRQVAIFCFMVLKGVAGVFAFPCTTILLTNSAKSLRLLGTLNGVSTSLSAIGRAAGPSLSGAMFTFGIDVGYIILPWWLLAFFALLALIPTWWIVESEGFGSADEDDEDEDAVEPVAVPSGPRGPEEAQEEETDVVTETTPLMGDRDRSCRRSVSRSSEQHPGKRLKRQVSGPLGMMEPLGRSLSNGLGQTMSGHGAGGTTYH